MLLSVKSRSRPVTKTDDAFEDTEAMWDISTTAENTVEVETVAPHRQQKKKKKTSLVWRLSSRKRLQPLSGTGSVVDARRGASSSSGAPGDPQGGPRLFKPGLTTKVRLFESCCV